LALLRDLEASLEATQKAVLARDLSGLERSTGEQLRLQRALAILWAESGTHPKASLATWLQGCAPQLAAELRAAEMRVLYLGRVQAGLLVRAQRSLRMIAHLLAGPESNYSPVPAQMEISVQAPAPDRGEERPCQA
jgi:hypothetical protein